MTSMLDDLRARYDLVLIDTGPVPGPMDSSVMAACADGVIMVVSRGEYNAQVRNAIEHLHLVNAPLTGLVYNRARSREIERSGHSSSVGSDPAAVKANGNGNGDWSSYADAYADYGPLPQSVLAMHAEM
jgi:Mrp family chromosome partitioning ATPase